MKNIKDHFNHEIVISELKPKPMSENAQWLLEQRYLANRYDYETKSIRKERDFAELVQRVSRVIASAETLYTNDVEWIRTLEKNIAADMLAKRFCFNSPCLFNAGAGMIDDNRYADLFYKPTDEVTLGNYRYVYGNRQENQQLFACFVIDVPDSMEGIFEALKEAAMISKFGGGVGASFGHIRERGAKVHDGGNGGIASGPVSFMRNWDTMADVVVQGGKRRAALMGILPDNHPDILDFIHCKTQDNVLPYFNISVAVSDKLMELVQSEEDDTFILETPRESDGEHTTKEISAKELFNALVENAWKRGDPGVFFIDTANKDNLLKMSDDWKFESTNPCGEQPLPNNTSCNLGSINLSEFVYENKYENKYFDFGSLNSQIMRSIYYLDLVIDACSYPLSKIEERTKKIRPVGLGMMGLADFFIKTDIVYGSEKSKDWAEIIAQNFASTSLTATTMIANMKGAFPENELVTRLNEKDWPKSLIKACEKSYKIDMENKIKAGQLRNSRRLSIAPTGSISMIFDASPGIEPNFAWHWTRKVTAPNNRIEERDFWHPLLTDEMKQRIKNGEPLDEIYIAAHEITPDQHVEMMATFAPYIDSAISKTVNLPYEATVEDVKRIYFKAYNSGCKGITIYRDGSRSTQPIETKQEEQKSKEAPIELPIRVKTRPAPIIHGKTIKETTPWGSIYVTLNFDGSEPFETFINVGKSGSELKAMTEALSRAISIGLRSGCHLEDFINTLRGLSGKEYWMLKSDDQVVRSLPDIISILLEKLSATEEQQKSNNATTGNKDIICPECGSPMELISGCEYCFSCGYSPCK